MEVHRGLGPGFLEEVDQEARTVELSVRGIPFQREVELPIAYKGKTLQTAYRADFICYDEVVIELKSIKQLGVIEEAQLLNYLKATGYQVGLLINFGAASLETRRFVN